MSDALWLVVGLGNPGPSYAETRHNVGAMVLDLLAARAETRLKAQRRTRADVAEVRFGGIPGNRAVLARPRSYMNESGGPVARLVDFYKVPLDHVLVVYDELDLPFGTIRLKRGGGDNGHNGLRSIRASLGSGDYCRLRIGIGRPPGRMDPAAYVLKPFSAAERRDLEFYVDRAADAAEAVVVDGLVYAQNHYNG
ncbi:aminoacyl-tRNA hydrolase [Haloactinopolyspora sp.]|uniref:aminoacyl-tRNA hydrolase n=1 Tax=Haloactinopolyspora sp. TaxID=1966353 RepID=UPI00261F0319|nr:aminoacyl-tRNA hydrolase [Haloactinopolyspora sp.]